jgi:hypothetical protein
MDLDKAKKKGNREAKSNQRNRYLLMVNNKLFDDLALLGKQRSINTNHLAGMIIRDSLRQAESIDK